jgi:hypothetical protein
MKTLHLVFVTAMAIYYCQQFLEDVELLHVPTAWLWACLGVLYFLPLSLGWFKTRRTTASLCWLVALLLPLAADRYYCERISVTEDEIVQFSQRLPRGSFFILEQRNQKFIVVKRSLKLQTCARGTEGQGSSFDKKPTPKPPVKP